VDRYLDSSEEATLVCNAARQIYRVCALLKPPPPPTLWITAIAYLHRFYLNNTVMDHVPEKMVPACVFLACKTGDYGYKMLTIARTALVVLHSQQEAAKESEREATAVPPPADATAARTDTELVSPRPQPPTASMEAAEQMMASMRNVELTLCQQLQFHFVVYGPIRPLRGFLTLLRAAEKKRGVGDVQIKQEEEVAVDRAQDDACRGGAGGAVDDDKDTPQLDVEAIAVAASGLVERWWTGAASLCLAPSRLALAAVLAAAKAVKADLDLVHARLSAPLGPGEALPDVSGIAAEAEAMAAVADDRAHVEVCVLKGRDMT
jgi:hypothetical protein